MFESGIWPKKEKTPELLGEFSWLGIWEEVRANYVLLEN